MPKYKKKLKVIDLFSGLGGFSQAFLDRGHDITRYELDELFKDIPCTIIKDVYDLTSNDLKNVDIILASPPCTHFSVAALYHHWPKRIPTKATLEQIELVKHTIKIIKGAKPQYWILENPRGMLRKVIGKPAITQYWGSWGMNCLKPTDLWGKFPPIDWRTKEIAKYEYAPRGSKKGIQGKTPLHKRKGFSWNIKRDSAERALIPYDFSLAVCLAVEGNSQQETLV